MGADFKLQPYDRFYYSAKMKKARLNLSEDEVKTYFNIDSVQVNGVFYAAHRVYGLNFKERKDLPTYHSDMKVFEVSDATGKLIALFYSDDFRHPTKRGGAWMTSYFNHVWGGGYAAGYYSYLWTEVLADNIAMTL